MSEYPQNTAFWELDDETEEVTDMGSYTLWPDPNY